MGLSLTRIAGWTGLSALLVLFLAGFHNWEPHRHSYQGVVLSFPAGGTGIVTGVAKTFKTEQECKAWEVDTRHIMGKIRPYWGDDPFDITGGCKKVG